MVPYVSCSYSGADGPNARNGGRSMKIKARSRILSVLMALVMVLSLAPVALAEGETITITPSATSVNAGQSITLKATATGAGPYYVLWELVAVPGNSGKVSLETYSTDTPILRVDSDFKLKGTSVTVNAKLYAYDETTQSYTGSVLAQDSVSISINDTLQMGVVTAYGSPSNRNTVPLDNYSSYDGDYYEDFSVTTYLNDEAVPRGYEVSYTWTLDGQLIRNASSYSYRLYAYGLSNTTYKLRCTATVYEGSITTGTRVGEDYVEWTVSPTYTSSFNVSATVYDTNPGYALTDVPDEGNKSIADQIDDYLYRNGSRYDYYYTISFTDTGYSNNRYGYLNAKSTAYDSGELSNITFEPQTTLSTSTSTATASYRFTVNVYRDNNRYPTAQYSGTMTFTIKQGEAASTNTLTLTGESGKDLELSASDFTSWWNDLYSNGSLTSVKFTSLSSGNLYSNYNGSRGTSVVGSNASSCYVNPGRNQTGIDGLTFVPSNNKAATVTLKFTATGTTSKSSSSSRSRSGTATILLTNTVDAITYSTGVNGSVDLVASDFTNAYKQAVGNNSSSLTFRFQNVPANGTLTFKNGSRTTTLTSSNVKSQSFTTSTISNVTYTAGRTGTTDSVQYICYSGGTARFTGTITFNAKPQIVQNLVKNLTCTSASGLNISALDIWGLDATMQYSSFVIFGTPSAGALYIQDTALLPNTRLSFTTGTGYQTFTNVTYKPASGATTGMVSIPFGAYDINGNQTAAGTVQITLNVPASTTPTTPTNPTTPSPVKRAPVPTTIKTNFGDVPSGSWYYNEVMTLTNAGIVGGTGGGNFEPNRNVTYGEALALIMRAVGYNIQQGTGSNWAIPFLTQAAQDGLLPNAYYDLNAPIDRNTIASVTAKAMKLTPVTNPSSSPFPDTSDPYVLALHYAGIVAGDSEGFRGTAYLTRAEVSMIIWRIYDKRENPDTNQTQQPSQQPSEQQPSTSDPTTREPDRNPPYGY